MPDFIEPLRRRLVELGCPMKQVRRLVREVADHREDLKQAALAEGLSETEAEARANTSLGDPVLLAEDLMASLRRSTWWGRHHVVAFGLLPLLAYPVLWALLFTLELALEFALGYSWDAKKLQVAVNNPVTFRHLSLALHFMDYAAIASVALLFGRLARRSAVKFKWTVIACAICSVYGLFTWVSFGMHSLSLGFTVSASLVPQWTRAAIPLLVAGAIYILQRRTIRRFREQVAG